MTESGISNRWLRALRFLFGFRESVRRLSYLLIGLGLAALKYIGDLAILDALGYPAWTPGQFLSPFYTVRFAGVSGSKALLLLGLWALPFVWIGASMTYRRAVDAGLPGPMSLFFFMPGLNYLLIVPLCIVPSWSRPVREERPEVLPGVSSAPRLVLSVGVGALVGLLVFWVAVAFNQSYGLALFIGSPFAIGFVAAALYGSDQEDGRRTSPALVGQLAVLVAGGALLLLGLEGIICLAMAYPLAAILAFLGSQLGALRPVASRWGAAHLFLLVTLLPFLAAMEAPRQPPPLREVVSSIDIDAPPEVVWQNVISFSELPPPSDWTFRTGIAYPVRARIDGHGEGAVRHCEFSTGAFVEPITRWDEPNRLSFNVVAQPPSMEEWSPYRHIQPAHVTQSLRSERGEFRLVRLPNGGTRLEGSTWYRVELFPQPYWTLWSDAVIHRIHDRVLRHIQALSES